MTSTLEQLPNLGKEQLEAAGAAFEAFAKTCP